MMMRVRDDIIKTLKFEYSLRSLSLTPFKVYGMSSDGSVDLYLNYLGSEVNRRRVNLLTKEEKHEFFMSLIPEDEEGDFTLDKFNEEEITGCTGLVIMRQRKILYFIPAEWRKNVIKYDYEILSRTG